VRTSPSLVGGSISPARLCADVAYALLRPVLALMRTRFVALTKTRPQEWGRCTHECVRHILFDRWLTRDLGGSGFSRCSGR
jgi:hypothetical protein